MRHCLNPSLLFLFCLSAAAAFGESPLSGSALYRDVEHYASISVHRAGSPGDRLTSRWLALEMEDAGYDVVEQDWKFNRYALQHCSLEWSARDSFVAFPIWMPPGGSFDLEAPLAEWRPEGEESLDGRIAVAGSSRITRVHWSTGVNELVLEAARRGASAVVFVLAHPSGEIAALNAREPFHQQSFPIPALVVPPAAEPSLLAAAAKRRTARLRLKGTIEESTATNVIASLDRAAPWIVISTPTSGWFSCGGERGPGVALLLGLARWARDRQLPFNLRFIANSGHELDNLGAHASLESFAPPPEDVACWIHLGASISTREWETGSGRPLPLDAVNTAGHLVTVESLLSLARESFGEAGGYEPRVGGFLDGELKHFIAMGYPALGFFGPHFYFHTPADGALSTSPELLEPVAQGLETFILGLNPANRPR